MTIHISVLIIPICFLIVLSAFFSAAETGIMALNRYRLRHAARQNDPRAKRVLGLLARPDRILGIILIGNTFANVFASAITTILAAHYFGEFGVLMVSIILTFVLLIFSESTPKTLAALYPEQIALPASGILKFLLKLLYPLVWIVNFIGNGILRLFGAKLEPALLESLSIDELRTLLDETQGKISTTYKKMLLKILDLEQVTVEEIMVPRNEIFGIDLNESWDQIIKRLFECPYSAVPLYTGDINNSQGMLNLKQVLITLQHKTLNPSELIQLAEEIYFVPQDASTNQMLLNFRDQKQTIGLVVDEYGDIQGLITLQNILQEIVGAFTQDMQLNRLITQQKDGSYLVDGSADLRDINEKMDWRLPTDGPRTLSGLIVEYLETIPASSLCTRIAGYPIEVLRVGHATIKLIRIWPQLYQEPATQELK
ncbi:MAG: HlyC/CorC family transporter [Proteobacteria bacterium]|nr:HlyC/CorC family transporter [Pseudomonadota bacterium]